MNINLINLTVLSREKSSQRLKIPHKDALTNEYVGRVSSNQIIDELNKTI